MFELNGSNLYGNEVCGWQSVRVTDLEESFFLFAKVLLRDENRASMYACTARATSAVKSAPCFLETQERRPLTVT